MHATHDVMRGGADFHRLLGNVDVAQCFELVMHARELAFDMLFRI
jgi:hypothetical protein